MDSRKAPRELSVRASPRDFKRQLLTGHVATLAGPFIPKGLLSKCLLLRPRGPEPHGASWHFSPPVQAAQETAARPPAQPSRPGLWPHGRRLSVLGPPAGASGPRTLVPRFSCGRSLLEHVAMCLDFLVGSDSNHQGEAALVAAARCERRCVRGGGSVAAWPRPATDRGTDP